MRRRVICLLTIVSLIVSACSTQIGSLRQATCSKNVAVDYIDCLITNLNKTPQGSKSELTRDLIVALANIRNDVNDGVATNDQAMIKVDGTIKDYTEREENENGKKVAIGLLAVVAIGAGAYALSRTGGGGGGYTPTTSYAPSTSYDTPLMCSAAPLYSSPRSSVGKACGDSCIDADKTCRVGRGSACNLAYHSYP